MPRKKNSQYITKNHLIARYKAGAKRQYVNDIPFVYLELLINEGQDILRGALG